MKRISFVIPSLNEEEGIGKTLTEIPVEKLEKMGYDVEIIVVDGNSADHTREIAQKCHSEVLMEKEKGYGRAYKTGFKRAKGDIIITLDADASYPAGDVSKFVELLFEQDLYFITTNRFAFMERGTMDPPHKIGNNLLTFVLNKLFPLKINDSQSGMWIFRKEILKDLDLSADGMELSEEIKIKAFQKFRAKEVSIRYRKRLGVAKVSFHDGIRNLLFLFKLRIDLCNRQK
jgi:glycosyltransferase involved in cell wall biosynthesis